MNRDRRSKESPVELGQLEGADVVIAHYGEDLVGEDGYRPIRYGQFARRWQAAGTSVTRVAPSFSHRRRAQRPVVRSSENSGEGGRFIVRTPGYSTSRGLQRAAFLVAWAVGAAAAARRLQPAVILTSHPPPGFITLARLFRVRSVIVADIRDAWFVGPRRLSRVLRVLMRWELGRADAIVALSPALARRAGWLGELTVIPMGLDVVSASAKSAPPAIDDSLRAVFVGTLNDRFDLEDWIRSWPAAGDAVLDIFGAGPHEDRVRRACDEHPRVRYLGSVPSALVPQTLNGYDVGLVPTTAGFGTHLGNKVGEYLSAGLFVLHSLELSVGDELEERQLAMRCADPADLPTLLTELAGNATRMRTERAARQAVAAEQFSWDRRSSEMKAVLEQAWRRRNGH